MDFLWAIKDRYFRNVRGIQHLGDCAIYQADKPFCSCGLLHDLNWIHYNLAMLIYPNMEDDTLKQEGTSEISPKEQEQALKYLESIFEKVSVTTHENVKEEYKDYIRRINIVFGDNLQDAIEYAESIVFK